MTILTLANIIIFITAFVGMLLVAHKSKWGFIVFFLVELSMAYIGAVTGNYGLVITALMYFCMNIYSFIKWSR